MSEPDHAADGASRRPRSVYGEGSEPDPRLTLANERTALAWVRTGLALVAGGVGLTSLVSIADLPALHAAVGVVHRVALRRWRRRLAERRTWRELATARRALRGPSPGASQTAGGSRACC